MKISIDYVEHWKYLGDKEDSPINQFFYYFVAFNCLYEKVYLENHPFGDDDMKERDKIDEFLEDSLYTSYKKDGFAPCADLSKIPELAKGVAKGPKQIERLRGYSKINRDASMKDQEKQLFMNIYQVRCNLFHGQKELMNDYDRNFRLIAESASVLKELLTICLVG